MRAAVDHRQGLRIDAAHHGQRGGGQRAPIDVADHGGQVPHGAVGVQQRGLLGAGGPYRSSFMWIQISTSALKGSSRRRSPGPGRSRTALRRWPRYTARAAISSAEPSRPIAWRAMNAARAASTEPAGPRSRRSGRPGSASARCPGRCSCSGRPADEVDRDRSGQSDHRGLGRAVDEAVGAPFTLLAAEAMLTIAPLPRPACRAERRGWSETSTARSTERRAPTRRLASRRCPGGRTRRS